jgi:magnesium transporter
MTAPAELAPWLLGERNGFRWYHVEDLSSPALEQFAAAFGLHELAIEDCRDQLTRAKLEEYEGHLFLVANTVHFDPETCTSRFGEFDIFVGREFLLSVHRGPSRTAAAVRQKFEAQPRLAHPGRLLHALLDVIVDRYLPVLDSIEDRIRVLEERVVEDPSPALLAELFRLRRALVDFRRTAATMREVLNQLLHCTEPWIRSQYAYFRDVYDHLVRAMDLTESYREILTGLLDVHLSATANRANLVMKALTIFATLALPFLLVTGFYGMNFPNLPLLEHRFGWWVATGVMTGAALGLLWLFRRKYWL